MNDATESISKLTCQQCRRSGAFTEPISVILVFAPGLGRPYPLIPADDYSICSKCDAVFALVDRATQSHSVTREAGHWTRAILLFSDGRGLDVTAKKEPKLELYGKVAMA